MTFLLFFSPPQEKNVDTAFLLWYSEECYIMARYAYLSKDEGDHAVINKRKKQG